MGKTFHCRGNLSFENAQHSSDDSLEYCYFCEKYVHFNEFANHIKDCIPIYKEMNEHIPMPLEEWPRKRRTYMNELCIIFEIFLYLIGLKPSYVNNFEWNDDIWITIRSIYIHLYNLRGRVNVENNTLPIIEKMCESQSEAIFNIKIPLIHHFQQHFEECGLEIAVFKYRQDFDVFEFGQSINEEIPPTDMRPWPLRAYFRRNYALNIQMPTMNQYLYNYN